MFIVGGENMEDKKKKILNVIEWVVTIIVILLAASWFIGFKVRVNDEGETKCYNFWDREVQCR